MNTNSLGQGSGSAVAGEPETEGVLSSNQPLHGYKLSHAVRTLSHLAEAPITVGTRDTDSNIEMRAVRWGTRRACRKPVALRPVVDEVPDTLRGL